MRRSAIKTRSGGPAIAEIEQRFLDGDTKALRALMRQAAGPNLLDVRMADGAASLNLGGSGADGRLEFDGYASITDSPYVMQDWLGDYTEVVNSGAFAKTLGVAQGNWSQTPDVIFCLNHNWDAAPMARTIAGTLRLMEDSTGLNVNASFDAKRSDVYILQSAMEAGELDAMSFAFWTTRQQWSPDYEQRDILEVDMDGGDVSEVTWPANPATAGTTALRSRQAAAFMRSRVMPVLLQRARSEKREGKTLSSATTETLQAVLSMLGDVEDSVTAGAKPLLVELLGDAADTSSDVDSDGEGADTDAQTNSKSTPNLALLRARELERVR